LALRSLSRMTKKSVHFLKKQMLAYYQHDWSRDIFSRGAYSYILKGGLEKSKRLRKPIENTIFFAGEAMAVGSARGTVHGAIESGLHAAKLILKN
jgi:monoamine oxidase